MKQLVKKYILKLQLIIKEKMFWEILTPLISGAFALGWHFGGSVYSFEVQQLRKDTAALKACINSNCICNSSICLDPTVYDLNGNPIKNREVPYKIIVKGHATNVASLSVYLVIKSGDSYIQPSNSLKENVDGYFTDTCFLGDGAYKSFNGVKSYTIYAIATDTSFSEYTMLEYKHLKHIKIRSKPIPSVTRIR